MELGEILYDEMTEENFQEIAAIKEMTTWIDAHGKDIGTYVYKPLTTYLPSEKEGVTHLGTFKINSAGTEITEVKEPKSKSMPKPLANRLKKLGIKI